MAHGIKIYNESGYTQIDQDFRNHEIVEQGTIYVPSGGVEFNVYEGYRQVNPLAMLLVQNDSESDYIAYTQSFESAGIAYLVLVREGPVLVGEVSGSISPGTTISYRIAIPAQSSYGWTTSWTTQQSTTTSWTTGNSTTVSTSISTATGLSTSVSTSQSTNTSWATSRSTSQSTTTSWSTSQSTYGTSPYQYSIATPYYHVEVGSYDLWYWNDVPVYNAPAAGLTSVTVGNYIYTRGPLQETTFVKGTYYYYYSISRQEIVSTSWTTSISTTTSWTTSWTTNQSTTTTWTTSWTTGQSTTTSWTTSWTTGFNTSQSTTTTWATSITTGASPAASGGYGIKIFNPSGEPVFDSNKKYVKFHQLVSLNRDTSPNTQESYTNLAVANYTPTPSIPWIEIGDISGTRLYFEVLGDPISGAYIVFAWAAVKTQNSLGVAKLRYVGGTPSNLGGYFTYLNLSTVAQILFSRD